MVYCFKAGQDIARLVLAEMKKEKGEPVNKKDIPNLEMFDPHRFSKPKK
jgi:hypothetical protein